MADVTQPLFSKEAMAAIGAAIAIGLSALATAWSQATVGSAAMGAVSERPELSGNVILWMAIPETMVIIGLIVSIMIISRLTGGIF